jgi:hypothetical protein
MSAIDTAAAKQSFKLGKKILARYKREFKLLADTT